MERGEATRKATGELVERSTYQAYGGSESDYRPERWKSFREDYRFTGKEEDVEVGLIYFGARFLNPLLNRWVSADPLAVQVLGADPNLYAYVSGETLKAIDPLGLCSNASPCPNSGAEGAGGNDDAVSAAAPESPITVLAVVEVVGNLPPPISGGEEGAGNATEQYDYRQHGSDPSRQRFSEKLAWAVLANFAPVALLLEGIAEAQHDRDVEKQGRVDAGRPPMSEQEELERLADAVPRVPSMRQTPAGKVDRAKPSPAGRGGPPSSAPGAKKHGKSGGAMSADEDLDWSPNRTSRWGHTFKTHGAGARNTKKLAGRAAGEKARNGKREPNGPQGQWLDNEAAGKFLSAKRPYIKKATVVDLPQGMGQIVHPDGSVQPASRALLVPNQRGGFTTAYPIQ